MPGKTELLDARVREALEKARAASDAALAEFMNNAKLDTRGLVVDSSGWAMVTVLDPGLKLVNSLKRVGVIRSGRTPVTLLAFGAPRIHPAYQSLAGNDAACKAAAKVLNDALPGLGSTAYSP